MAVPEQLEDLLIEFHDCARYDELGEVKKFLEDPRINIDGQDFNGSTALHKAAANGHLQVVEYLISRGAKYLRNLNGHTPLSWAVQTRQLEMIKHLLEAFDEEIDVLTPGKFTKSILHLAFDSGESEIVELILGHSSAKSLEQEPAEELDDEKVEEPEYGGGGAANPAQVAPPTPAGIGFAEHNLRFNLRVPKTVEPRDQEEEQQQQPPSSSSEPTPITLTVRELPVAASLDGVFNQQRPDGASDQTGLALWASSVVLSRWLADRPAMLRGKRKILELGSGCGLSGMLAATVAGPDSRVLLTDFAPHALKNLAYNVELNQIALGEAGVDSLGVQSIDWTDPETWPRVQKQKQQAVGGGDIPVHGEAELEKFDVCLLSDCLYQKELLGSLAATVSALLRPDGGQLLMVSPVARQGAEDFAEELLKVGLQPVSVNPAPKRYKGNCSLAQDDENFFAYFSELLTAEFRLYRFVRTQEGPLAQPGTTKKKKKKKRRPATTAKKPEL